MEIVIRTAETGTTVSSRSADSAAAPEGPPQVSLAVDAVATINAGPAPTPPDQSGAPPANVAATEPPRPVSSADQSAGAAPSLSSPALAVNGIAVVD